ncbi:hypothetical protein A2U01_0096201, partial [Trifolium medium]|nr:hypothetical protein [Trifolium medium]
AKQELWNSLSVKIQLWGGRGYVSAGTLMLSRA